MGCLLVGLAYLLVTVAVLRLVTDLPTVIAVAVVAPFLGGLAGIAVSNLAETMGL